MVLIDSQLSCSFASLLKKQMREISLPQCFLLIQAVKVEGTLVLACIRQGDEGHDSVVIILDFSVKDNKVFALLEGAILDVSADCFAGPAKSVASLIDDADFLDVSVFEAKRLLVSTRAHNSGLKADLLGVSVVSKLLNGSTVLNSGFHG